MMLIGQFDSPFVRRVALAATHYGVTFEHRPWSVWGQADAIAGYNPLRRVPVLVRDDGEVLVDSGAILDSLDDDAPGDAERLVERSGPRRRATLRVCAFATGAADKAVSLAYEGLLRSPERRSAVWVERCTQQIHDTLAHLERERAARPGPHWFETLSHADIAVGCALRFIREALPGVLSARPLPALAAHAERCEATPLFQSAVQPFQVVL